MFQSAVHMADAYYWQCYFQLPTAEDVEEFILFQGELLHRTYQVWVGVRLRTGGLADWRAAVGAAVSRAFFGLIFYVSLHRFPFPNFPHVIQWCYNE